VFWATVVRIEHEWSQQLGAERLDALRDTLYDLTAWRGKATPAWNYVQTALATLKRQRPLLAICTGPRTAACGPQATDPERSDHIVGQNSTRGPFQESFRGGARASA
jgi:hypothetical protein